LGIYEIRGATFDGRNFRPWNGEKWGFTYGEEDLKRLDMALSELGFIRDHGEDMTGWRGVQK
jgi:hypothetical protein